MKNMMMLTTEERKEARKIPSPTFRSSTTWPNKEYPTLDLSLSSRVLLLSNNINMPRILSIDISSSMPPSKGIYPKPRDWMSEAAPPIAENPALNLSRWSGRGPISTSMHDLLAGLLSLFSRTASSYQFMSTRAQHVLGPIPRISCPPRGSKLLCSYCCFNAVLQLNFFFNLSFAFIVHHGR